LQVCSVVETHLYHRGNSSCCWCERVAKGLPDIFLFNRTVPKVTPQPKSQTPTFVRWMSTSQIVADYPQHRTGQSINIKGNNYNDVSYLKPFGDLVFTNYCPIHPSMMQNGEYRWQVLERIYGNSSQIEIHGYSEQGSFVAGVLFGTRVPNGSTNFNATKINEFSADKSSVITGESFNLRWNTQNAKSVMIIAPGRIFDGRTFPNVGSVQVNASSSPGKDTYILVAKGCDSYGNNMDVQQQIEIDVKSNPIAIASDSGNKTLPTVSNHTNKAISKNNQVPVKEDKLVFLFDIAVKGTLIFSLGTGAYGLISFLYSQFNAITSSNSSVIIKSENDHNHQENAKDELQDYQRAIADYDQAISLNPNDASAYYNRGLARYKLEDYQGAIADYNQAISLNPNDASAYYNRGKAKYELKDYQGAIADYTQAIKINPNDADAYINRGKAKRNLDDLQGAIADYNQAIRINPNYAYAYYNRGIAKYEIKDYQGAIADYTQAIEINPNYADAYIIRGNTKYDLNDLQGAIADYTQVIRIDPNDASAYSSRGIFKHELRDYQGAIADYNQAIKIDPNDDYAYTKRGNAKHELRDYQGAIADYTQAIRINPIGASAYDGRGLAKINSNDRSGGCVDLSRAIDLGSEVASRNYQEYCR